MFIINIHIGQYILSLEKVYTFGLLYFLHKPILMILAQCY